METKPRGGRGEGGREEKERGGERREGRGERKKIHENIHKCSIEGVYLMDVCSSCRGLLNSQVVETHLPLEAVGVHWGSSSHYTCSPLTETINEMASFSPGLHTD